MKILTCALGALATNAYLLLDELTGAAAMIDPGAKSGELDKMLTAEGVKKVEYIILTHGHFDHILAVKDVQEKTGAKIAVHTADKEKLSDGRECRAFLHDVQFTPSEADVLLNDGDVVRIGNLEVKVMHTPGHTPGSVCLICEDVMFSGDTLFAGSVGRTDLAGGSMKEMMRSAERLAALDGKYKVLPGHGDFTTLERERETNPYMAGYVL